MKYLLLITACFGFMATAVLAQTTSTPKVVYVTVPSDTKNSGILIPGDKAKPVKYYCPKCMASGDKPGTCPKCKVKMVREGDFYCPKCGISSVTPGKCPKCQGVMKEMEAPATPKKQE